MSARRPAPAAAALAILLAAAEPSPAYEPPAAPAPIPGAVVGEVRVERTNVFDPAVPGEAIWPFRIADKIHFVTRESVIRRELLFAPGDPWNPLKVLESERNLRANGSFRRAEIVPERRADGTVDAVVRTQDSWTTNVRFSAGTEGGESFLGYGLEEGNVLGYGKSLLYMQNRVGSKTTSTYAYGDPRFLGTRLSLDGAYARSTVGDSASASLTRPFYSLDSGHAVAAAWNRTLGDVSLYRDAAESTKFRERRRVAEGSMGARLTESRGFVQRGELGWYSERAQFEPLAETREGTLPADRELSGPTLGYSWVQPIYVKETYVDRMERVEDFNLGNELAARAGWMHPRTGSDRERWIFNVSDQQGLGLGPGRFGLIQAGLKGRLAGGRWENALLHGSLSAYWKTGLPGDHTLVMHAEGAAGRYLDRENQIILGGNTGLRGYKNNGFTGGKASLVNVEDRFFLDREWFHLVRLGGAVFFDTGAVIPEGGSLMRLNFKSDAGIGLRVASTRSRTGSIGRVDLAYALNAGPGGSRWVLSIKGGQAFSFATSISQGVESSPPSRLQ